MKVKVKPNKMFSPFALYSSTFLGGPLAFLAMGLKNYFSSSSVNSNGKIERGPNILFMTAFIPLIVVYVALYFFQVNIARQSALWFGVMAGSAYVYKPQSDKFLEMGGKFYSGWKVIGVLLTSTILTIILAVGVPYGIASVRGENPVLSDYFRLSSSSFDVEEHNILNAQYFKNEQAALSIISQGEADEAVRSRRIWEANAALVVNMRALKDKPQNFIEFYSLIDEYTSLRIQETEIIESLYVSGETTDRVEQLKSVQLKLDSLVFQINKISL